MSLNKKTRVPAPDEKRDLKGNVISVLSSGTVLDNRYELTYLTAGGMGVIYKAKDINTGLSCIVKEIVTDLEGSAHKLKSFIREKEMLSKFYHPGIVNLLDYFQEDGNSYLVLEYVEGFPLDEYIKTGKTSINKVIHWAILLCNALEYLHSMSPPVIYRDLKPENILVDNQDRIKLIDFGIARTYKEEQEKDTEAVGSPGFASPEQYGTKQTDGRSDIYSLGALMHYLFTEQDPREKEKPFIFVPVRSYNNTVPAGLEGIVARCLELKPEDRYENVGELKKALKDLTESYPYEGEIPLPEDTPEEKGGQEEITPFSFPKTFCYIVFDMVILGFFVFFVIPWSLSVPDKIRGGAWEQGMLASCESNLKNIATSLEMYATDNMGDYPPDINFLTEQGYSEKLPVCSYSKKAYGYAVNSTPDNFTLWCTEPNSHLGSSIPEGGGYPQYTPGEGIKLKD